MKRFAPRQNFSVLVTECLEDRRLLAAFGEAWPQQRELTISFPADEVGIGQYQNDINDLLDSVVSRQAWQELALRAYQTWAIHADINVGLRSDYNNDFGVPGLIVGDPRFGDFRIGAFPQSGLVASSVPFQAIAGTYSGDLLLNSNEQFTFHDWGDGQGPDPQSIEADHRDIFSLFLHESGNTLGLDDNQLDWSVMFRQYTGPKGVLSAEDIDAIQALYGQRNDPFESVSNDQVQQATLIPAPVGLDPQNEVIRSRGSLQTGLDVDHYKFVPVSGQDSVTIRLRVSGVSLLQAKLELVDAAGQTLSTVSSSSVFDNDCELTVPGIDTHDEIFLRVSAADTSDVYSVGDYWIELDYRTTASQSGFPQLHSYDEGPEQVFQNFPLLDDEIGTNDSIAFATTIAKRAWGDTASFEFQSSVSSASDVDYLKLVSPSEPSDRLVISVAGVGANPPFVKASVVDSSGQPVGTAAKLHDDGTFSVEVANPMPSTDYFLVVSVDTNSAVGVGNYVAVAEYVASVNQMNQLSQGTIDGRADHYIQWTATKTKLFRFDLTADGGILNHAVRLVIYDAHTREIAAVVAAQSGTARSVLAWLQQGDYILRFTAISRDGNAASEIGYSLLADGVSDDQDNDGNDPDQDDEVDPYDYTYGSGSDYDGDPVYDYYDYYN